MNCADTPSPDLALALGLECDALAAMVTLLDAECRALRDDDAGRVEQIAGEKLRLAQQIAVLVEQRRALFGGPGETPTTEPEATLWRSLRELAQTSERKNWEIGILLKLRSDSVGRALAFLSSFVDNGASTYDTGGRPRAAPAPRTLGIA